MPNELGVSFAPTFAGAEQARQQGAQAQPQGAIKTLNFRLPQVTGSASRNALSPLVAEQPVGGFGGSVLQSVLRTILGSDALSAFGVGQNPPQSSSPVMQTQDFGSDFLQSLTAAGGQAQDAPVETRDYDSDVVQAVRSAPPPETGPSDNINVPQFEGNIDTPPMQNGAPLFGDDAGSYQPNAWEALTMGDQMPAYMAGFQPWVPQRAPNPTFIVDQNPTRGGGRG